MLTELLAFASEGCLDISALREEAHEAIGRPATSSGAGGNGGDGDDDDGASTGELLAKRTRVLELIAKMRAQMEDLERLAYENGHGGMPMYELKERQRLVFDKLAVKMRLNIELERLSSAELTSSLDQHLDDVRRPRLMALVAAHPPVRLQFFTPIKEKEKLVDQLQTQITDLEVCAHVKLVYSRVDENLHFETHILCKDDFFSALSPSFKPNRRRLTTKKTRRRCRQAPTLRNAQSSRRTDGRRRQAAAFSPPLRRCSAYSAAAAAVGAAADGDILSATN